MVKLNKKEMKEFTNKYLPIWGKDIIDVSLLEYKGIKEFLVNRHYLVIDYGNRVVEKDLQFIEV